MNKKNYIIFDFDDTLVDSYDFNQQMFVDTFKLHTDVKPESESYLRNLHSVSRGTSMHMQFQRGARYLKLTLDPAKLVEENEKMHIKKIHAMKFFDGVEELLIRLTQDRKKVIVLSNRQTKSLTKVLSHNNFSKYFNRVISCTDTGYQKPDPYCLEMVVKEFGASKNKFLYVGDSQTDYKFAKEAKIDAIIIDQYLHNKKFFKLLNTII